MREETTTRTLYKFNELSEAAQRHALEQQAEYESSEFDPEYVYDDAVRMASIMGIEIDTHSVPLMSGSTRHVPIIYYSGFWSQGDGACFKGYYHYATGSVKAIKAEAPEDKELHRIAEQLQRVQAGNFYQVTASMNQSGHYMHSGCMAVDVERSDEKEMVSGTEEEITRLMRDFADWIYSQLETAYDYRTSEEACKESIEANDYEFTADGEMA